jgi:hypothetical protein
VKAQTLGLRAGAVLRQMTGPVTYLPDKPGEHFAPPQAAVLTAVTGLA